MPGHVVRAGDSIATIAATYGHLPDTLWNHPDNAALREVRTDPNVLYPGDRVFVPPLLIKEVPAATDALHRFRRKAVPIPIRIRLMNGDEPRAGLRYRFVVAGTAHEGTTNGDGVLEQFVPHQAKTAELTLVDDEETYQVHLGHLDPVDTDSGLRARLQNLRYAPADPSSAALQAAIEVFQREKALPVTGDADDATLEALVRAHGC